MLCYPITVILVCMYVYIYGAGRGMVPCLSVHRWCSLDFVYRFDLSVNHVINHIIRRTEASSWRDGWLVLSWSSPFSPWACSFLSRLCFPTENPSTSMLVSFFLVFLYHHMVLPPPLPLSFSAPSSHNSAFAPLLPSRFSSPLLIPRITLILRNSNWLAVFDDELRYGARVVERHVILALERHPQSKPRLHCVPPPLHFCPVLRIIFVYEICKQAAHQR